jgi:hypothetical protein
MVKSPIKESDEGLPHAHHYEFTSWKPVILKSPIDFNYPILLINSLITIRFGREQKTPAP